MNEKKIKTILILLALAAQGACADSAYNLTSRANRLYTEGSYNEAINLYDRALTEKPDALEAKFDKANCCYRLDDLQQAIDLYREVAADSKDMNLVAKAKYNLGNCYFQKGKKQTDSDLQKALEDLQSSIACWRQVLDIQPDNQNAAKNIEVARLTIKDIIDQINKQKQEQQAQQQKQQEQQEKLKQLLDRQKELAQKTQQTKDNADNNDITPQQAQDEYSKQAEEQSQLKLDTDQAAQEISSQALDPNNPNPQQTQQAAEELNKALDNQQNAQEKLNSFDPNHAKKSQDRAAQHIENAIKALSQQQQDQQQQQQAQQEQQQAEQKEKQQEQQQQQDKQKEQQKAAAPDVTAQEIIDKEQEQKKERQILQRPQWQKVEKDW